MFQMISYFIYCTFICCLPVPEVGNKKGDTSQENLKKHSICTTIIHFGVIYYQIVHAAMKGGGKGSTWKKFCLTSRWYRLKNEGHIFSTGYGLAVSKEHATIIQQ